MLSQGRTDRFILPVNRAALSIATIPFAIPLESLLAIQSPRISTKPLLESSLCMPDTMICAQLGPGAQAHPRLELLARPLMSASR
eukprot:54747-Amphidinium_carterae.1